MTLLESGILKNDCLYSLLTFLLVSTSQNHMGIANFFLYNPLQNQVYTKLLKSLPCRCRKHRLAVTSYKFLMPNLRFEPKSIII